MRRVVPVVFLLAALVAVMLGGTPAHAATVLLPDIPGASSVTGGLELNANGAALNAWSRSYGGGSCLSAGSGSKVSVVGGNLDLHSSGANGSCAVVAGSVGYLYGVFEYRINVPTYKGLIANWPAAWLVGGAWDTPSYQELDAFEGSIGHDSASYWTGNGAPAGDDVTGYSTNGSIDAYGLHGIGIPVLGPAIKSGWNTVDVVWSPSGFSVYANGKLYAQMPASEATPMKIVLDNTEGPNGLQPAGHASDFQVAYVRVWSYA
jgi:hypothetical protein